MTGLSLDRFQRHPRFAQPGQAGVAQLMTGRVFEPGAGLRAPHDLFETIDAQRPATPGAFQHDEQLVARRVGRPFDTQIVRHTREELCRQRHQRVDGRPCRPR